MTAAQRPGTGKRSRASAVAALVAVLGACSAGPEPPRTAGTQARSTASATATDGGAAPLAAPVRRPLGAPTDEALEVELLPMAGGARVLAVAIDGERVTWARTIDEAGAQGPARRFEGANVVTAFDAGDGRTTFVTSDGDHLCVTTFERDAAAPAARGCEAIRPEVVVPIGGKLALLSLDVKEPPARPAAKPRPAPAGAKKSAAAAKKGAAKSGAGKKGAGSAKKGAAKKGGPKKVSSPAKVPSSKARVDVRVAWATPAGAIDAASVSTGLTFERPLAGMMLADAAPRGAGADLLFYEHVARPKKRSKTPFGTARLAVASLDAAGQLAAGTRAALMEGDLEYGSITGWSAPRLVSSAAATALVAFSSRGGACRAERVLPSLGPSVTSKVGCQVDPLGWSAPQTAASERLFAARPRRAPGQTSSDAPLAVWAGDRAFFSQDGGGLGTASRADGAPRPMAPAFVARRSRVAWSAFAPDGEGVALASGRLFRVDVVGSVAEVLGPADIDRLGPRVAELVRAEGSPHERARAARIGGSFFLAREDVVRLSPEPLKIDALAGRAHPDGAALVGGRDRGALIEVASGVLRVAWLDAGGAVVEGPSNVSPIRSGLDAVERAAGGAIVVGVSADDPGKVVALTIDASGRVGAPRTTSLAVTPGEIGVRLVAMPGGGALLTDMARSRAAWLDDDAAELGAAALPAERAQASCLDGRPAPLVVPSPRPGELVRVPDLGAPGTCVTGELAWTAAGGLRWIGTTRRELASIAEIGVLDSVVPPLLSPAPAAVALTPAAPGSSGALPSSGSPAAAAPPAAIAPLVPACPSEMVSIAGRFCIDRLESSLADARTGRALSPDYPPTPNLLEIVLGDWATERAHWGDVHARAFPLPPVPAWQRGAKTEPVAVSRMGARPAGYITGHVAAAACVAAGKRLCTLDEHTTACRGEADADFPYGAEYQDGTCNVFREDHPAALLHHNASLGHLDPRLNRVRAAGKPLFETAGARPACRSVWGADAVYDLVGNLDEWVDEEGGAFAGGFYSRSTRAGCDAVITAHPRAYADYSTGIRCCRDAAP